MKPAYLIILLVMNFFWAAVYSAYVLLARENLEPGGIVTLRFGIAALCLLVAWPWLPGQAPRGSQLAVTCLLGLVVYVLGQRLQVYGNACGTAGNSATLMALEPLVTSLAAAVFLREHIGPRRLAGFGLALVGVALLNRAWRPDFHWASLGASLIFVSSFICEAAYSVFGKPITLRTGVMKMLTVSLLVGTAANLLIDGRATLTAAAALSPHSWLLVLALALVCTALGYTCWFVIIRDCPVNVAALTIYSQSVFGVAIAALWLGEAPHWGQLAGGLTIVAGLVLGLSRQLKKPDGKNQLPRMSKPLARVPPPIV